MFTSRPATAHTNYLQKCTLPRRPSRPNNIFLWPSTPRPSIAIPAAAAGVAAPSTAQDPRGQQPESFSDAEWDSFIAAFSSQTVEHAMFLDAACVVEGAIPAELRGTLLRNGPGLFEIGGKSVPQPFDGDGMVASFCFPGKGRPPFVANRFVRTSDFLAEQEAQRMLFRGAFGVGNPAGGLFFNPFDISVKKIANTGVVAWAGKILALYERDLPYEVAAPDLRTAGRTDCGGAIEGPYFAAHYRIETQADGESKRLVGFNAYEAGPNCKLCVWEFDEAGKMLHSSARELPDAAFAFLHDFAVTENYYIFLENPVRLDYVKLLTKYMFGKACIAECLTYDTARATKVHVIPRPGASGAAAAAAGAYPTPSPFFSFHHANAFEAQDGLIVVDSVAMHEGMDFSTANLEAGASYFSNDVGRGTLTRVVVDPRSGKVSQHKVVDRACEFPCVAPRVVGKAHSHTYMVGSKIDSPERWGATQVVMKVSMSPEAGVARAAGPPATDATQQVYHPGDGRWAGEPIFVPRPGGTAEDDGWVLVVVFDSAAKKTECVILNAQGMDVAARIRLPFFLPSGLHGSFTSAYMGPPPEQPYEASTYDIRNGAAKYE